VTAIVLSVSMLDTGRLAETAVICPEARYVSVSRLGSIARLHPSAAQWAGIRGQLALGLEPGPLDANSPIALAITGQVNKLRVVQYVSQRDIDASPFGVAGALDALLAIR
jgi:hypothetical protein